MTGIDSESESYRRFMAHLKFFSERLSQKRASRSSDVGRMLPGSRVGCMSFSYYNSRTVTADGSAQKSSGGNLFSSVKHPYLPQGEWGWAIDPIGFRITLNEIQARYGKPMFVVENGLGATDRLVSASSGEMRKRYGLIHVACDDQGRGTMEWRRKRSFHWYRELIASNGADLGA
ncbi:family 1 glycosylhydrolase [Actinomyces bowdenii]|uniref:Family 1 glycosylhydrolase n=1 Tax=Actinomyces bowdenii TaxID=131109 RepID=A0A853EKA5_9ACTO|nr:family 1 glycosylhydrolase [Actinomyces bowdenii]MBF0696469.1 family 1 glycosylhydrolase [Actinomyces bowdenii]MDO5064641.1 family 1 glycosylhydrolase [Actinomyces bowdenii]NYS68642.1 family 1 glycosylhydrolase [Actinomyces bowdenii]